MKNLQVLQYFEDLVGMKSETNQIACVIFFKLFLITPNFDVAFRDITFGRSFLSRFLRYESVRIRLIKLSFFLRTAH